MSAFRNHNHFPKEKYNISYLFPNVCFTCRKSFKKPLSEKPSICPNCTSEMVALNRKFSAPKAKDIDQWEKVQFLVNHGFLFQSVYETRVQNSKYQLKKNLLM